MPDWARGAAIGRRAVLGLLAWLLIMGRAAVGAVFSGIPLNARLRRIARSRRAAAARRAAEAELRERLAAVTAQLRDRVGEAAADLPPAGAPSAGGPSAPLVFAAFEDCVRRPNRFTPHIFPAGPPDPAALRGTIRVTAYFGTHAAAGDVPGLVRDELDRPLPEHDWTCGAGPAVIRHRAFLEPPDATVAGARAAYGAVFRWESSEVYLTVLRRPLLARLFRRGS